MHKPQTPGGDSNLTRRGFLKTSSTAVIGGSLLGGLSIERSAFAAPDDTLKIALIGCGGRGSGAAAQAMKAGGNVKLIAMADVSEIHLKNSLEALKRDNSDKIDVPEDHQFVGFDAYKKAIELADVVILATPPGFRPIHLEAAVAAGKNIFSEKPVATDAPGVRRVLTAAKLAKEKNLKIAVGLQRRHQTCYIETLKRLHDGAIGDIVSLRCYWNGNRPWQHPRKPGMTEMQYQLDNWYYFTWLCGDHIVEQHIHNLDVMNWIKNAHPVKAYGMGGAQKPRTSDDGEIFDHHFIEFEYADGARMYSQCRHIGGCWDSVSEHAQGTNGRVDLSDSHNAPCEIKGKNAWTHNGKQEDPWQLEHYPFFEAIRNNLDYNELERGAISTMTAIMGRMATYSGKELKWDDVINSKVDLMPESYSWDALPKPAIDPATGLYPMAMPGDPKWQGKIV